MYFPAFSIFLELSLFSNFFLFSYFSNSSISNPKICDISFIAEAPEDITLKQLLQQCDKIHPYWCACGICSAEEDDEPEIIINYDGIRKVREDVSCSIVEEA